MPKITFVCMHLGYGGAERVMSILINYYVRIGWDVQVIMLYENVIDYPIPKEVEIIFLGWHTMRTPFEFIQRMTKLRRIIKGDSVIAFLYSPAFHTVFSLLGSGKKVIVSERCDPSKDPVGWLHPKLRDMAYVLADTVVFQTQEARDYFSGRIRKHSVIIPNPISETIPARFCGERKKVIVAAGRLEEQKNFPMLIQAFARLSQEKPDYILKIFGQGPLKDELKELAASLGVGERVTFPGYVRDVDEQMRDAALYVSSSDFEGISNSMLEALAMGIPTICTDCPVGGAREMIEDGVNGLLVSVGDVEGLYQAMTRVLDNPDLAGRLSDQAVKIRERLSEHNILSKWTELIE